MRARADGRTHHWDCFCRPELVIDSAKDFSVSAVDPYESLHQHSQGGSHSGFATGSSHGQGWHEPVDALVEGKGMLSWTLAEKKEGTTMVCGRVIGPDDGSDMRRPSKRRKVEAGSDAFAAIAEGAEATDEDDSDSDEPEETLEIWLQLTEVRRRTRGLPNAKKRGAD